MPVVTVGVASGKISEEDRVSGCVLVYYYMQYSHLKIF